MFGASTPTEQVSRLRPGTKPQPINAASERAPRSRALSVPARGPVIRSKRALAHQKSLWWLKNQRVTIVFIMVKSLAHDIALVCKTANACTDFGTPIYKLANGCSEIGAGIHHVANGCASWRTGNVRLEKECDITRHKAAQMHQGPQRRQPIQRASGPQRVRHGVA